MAAQTVLYLLDYVDLGGGETSFLAFIEQLLRDCPRIRPQIVATAKGPLTDALEALGVPCRVVAYPLRLRRGPAPWFSLSAAGRLRAIAADSDPYLIHAVHFFGMLYGGWVARRLGLPLVWTCHGWFDVDRPQKRWIARRLATRISCVSESVAREARRALGCPERVLTNWLGIRPYVSDQGLSPLEERQTVRRELGIEADRPLAAVVGRFQPIKGHRYLLDALPEVLRRVPDLMVWFIGDALFGDPEAQAHKLLLQRRVEQEGLSGHVRFLGFRSDARRLMRALDALVVPSERESFCMAAVEGLEAGVPVVAPDGWGPREIVQSPSTGLLFEPGNGRDLAGKVIQVLLREGAGARFDPQAGPDRVGRLFGASAHLERTLAIYRSLLPDPAL